MSARKSVKVDIYLFGKSGKQVKTLRSARLFYIGVKALNFWFKGTLSARWTDKRKQEKIDIYLYELYNKLAEKKKIKEPKLRSVKPKVKLKLKVYDKDGAILSHKDKKYYYFRFLEARFNRYLKINENRYKEQVAHLFNLFYPSIKKFWKANLKTSRNTYIFRLMIGVKYKDKKGLEKQGWGADRALFITSESDLKKFLEGNLKFILSSKSGKRNKKFLEYVCSPSIEYAVFRGFSLEVITKEEAL